MPYDANGRHSLVPSYKATAGQTIRTEQHNPPFEDVSSSLGMVLVRDGRAPMTGPLNMNGFRITGLPEASNDGDPISYAQALALISDPWALQPIGAFIAYDAGEGLAPPPTNRSYRYVQLTAGLTESGGYNEGILTSETVSGDDPTISATAVVSLANSPLNGRTIRLINTERRFIRPGVAGALENSQNLAHAHGVTDDGHAHNWGNTARAFLVSAPGSAGGFLQGGASPGELLTTSATTGITIQNSGDTEARPRNIGVVYYRRVL